MTARKSASVGDYIIEAAPDVPRGNAAPAFLLISIDEIETATNVREDLGDLEGLAESIRAHGVLQPITVTQTPALTPRGEAAGLIYRPWRVLMGHRRFAAAKLAGLTVVPAIVDGRGADVGFQGPVRATEQLVENIQRADLNPIEEARAIKAILEAVPDLTQAELAKRLGRSAPWVSNSLRLLELDNAVVVAIAGGQLSAGHGKALAGLAKPTQRELAEEAIKRGASAHAMEDMVAAHRRVEEHRKETEARERKESAERKEKRLATIAGLPKRIPLDAPIRVRPYYYGGPKAETVVKELEEAGFTDVAVNDATKGTLAQRPKTSCDCTAWSIDITWGGGISAAKACTVMAHVRAATEAADAAHKVERDAQARAQEAATRELAGAIAELPADLLRVLFWVTKDWSMSDWITARRKSTGEKKAEAWDLVRGMTVDELIAEVAKSVGKGFTDRYGIKLPWQAIAEQLAPALAEAVA